MMLPDFELPTWVQFLLTVAGSWIAGVGTAWLSVWRRVDRHETRLQALEQTVYGRRGEDGIVHKVNHIDDGIDLIKRAVARICQKLDIEDGL